MHARAHKGNLLDLSEKVAMMSTCLVREPDSCWTVGFVISKAERVFCGLWKATI